MGGKASRDKGARGERMLRDELNARGFDVRRGFTFHHESDLIGLSGIHPECKFVEALNVRKAYAQAVEESEKRKDGAPTVFWKKSREPWLVVMDLDTFTKLYKGELTHGKNRNNVQDRHGEA